MPEPLYRYATDDEAYQMGHEDGLKDGRNGDRFYSGQEHPEYARGYADGLAAADAEPGEEIPVEELRAGDRVDVAEKLGHQGLDTAWLRVRRAHPLGVSIKVVVEAVSGITRTPITLHYRPGTPVKAKRR